MSWFWFAVYLRQTESQFTMRRLQKVQFEDGLQRARGVNVKFHIFSCLNMQESKQLNQIMIFFVTNLKQSYD